MSQEDNGLKIEVKDGRVTISFDQGDPTHTDGWSDYETELLKLYIDHVTRQDTIPAIFRYIVGNDIERRIGCENYDKLVFKLMDHVSGGTDNLTEIKQLLDGNNPEVADASLDL